MSSIYDALQRIQASKGSVSQGGLGGDSSQRRKIIWLVFLSVIVSSVCTAALFYGARALKGGNGEIEQVTSGKQSVRVDMVAPPVVQGGSEPGEDDAEGALEDHSRVPAEKPHSQEDYLRLGGLYYEAGEYDKALLTYTRALRYFRSDAKILNNIGSVLLAKGEMEKAVGYFVQANRVSGDFVEPLYNMACAYAKMGNEAEAVSSLKKAYKMNPDVMQWALQDPDLEELRGIGDFNAMIREH